MARSNGLFFLKKFLRGWQTEIPKYCCGEFSEMKSAAKNKLSEHSLPISPPMRSSRRVA